MKIITGASIFAMSKDNPAVLTIASGETLLFETLDCFSNQVTDATTSLDALDWVRINPATGPVAVAGAEPGDALKITILDIAVAPVGTMAAIPDNGVLGARVTESSVKRLPVSDGLVRFSDSIKLPADPMIGVIGVAPAGGAIPCGEPGSHGGNMDTTTIRKGAILYLPVFVPGALLAMGDVHACMGDGEIMVTGVEIPAQVTIKVELLKNANLEHPLLEDAATCYAIASHEDLEQAILAATLTMNRRVMDKLNLSFNEAGMLLSAAGNLEFCQVVDPKRTVRFGMPKTLLPTLF